MIGRHARNALAETARISRIIAGRWVVYGLMTAGLSLAYCASIIIGLYVHDELTYDRFIPNSDKIYLVATKYGAPDRPKVDSDLAPAGFARWMKTDLPEVDHVARLVNDELPFRTARRWVRERFYWSDADIFEVLNLPVSEGNLATALSRPGSVALTRRMAVAYFGRADAIGQTLVADGDIRLTVTAVLKDFPANTHLDREIFVAGGSGRKARLAIYDQERDLLWPNSYIYVTFKSGTGIAGVPAKLAGITQRYWQGPNTPPDGFALIPLDALHFMPHGDGEEKPRGHLDSIAALTGVAVAILALACINFSGLILAERQERAAEMTIYRALGARRSDLISQTLVEALIVSGLSAWLGLAAAERLLPALNRLLGFQLDLWTSPAGLLISVIGMAGVLAIASGIAPAIIVSRQIQTPPNVTSAVSMRWRSWVVAQLVLVIILLTASATMSRQWEYATNQALGFDGNNVVMVRVLDTSSIGSAFMRDVGSVPGVQAAAASWGTPTNEFMRLAWIRQPGRPLVFLARNSVFPDFLKVYRIKLLAGRNLSTTFVTPETPREVLINLTAVKALGFRTPEEAVGRTIEYNTDRTRMRSTVVGVLPDIRISTVYDPIAPMIFDSFSKYITEVSIRLDPARADDTIRRIDALWQRDAAGTLPIERRSFNDYLKGQYRVLHQQMLTFYTVSAAAIVLAILGLTGLSIFLTRYQVREIAIHKSLGATFGDLFQQRLAPFIAPILIANAMAWPVAWVLLSGWLNAFTDHIRLSPLAFMNAGAAVTAVALATVAIHSALVCRNISTAALRHE